MEKVCICCGDRNEGFQSRMLSSFRSCKNCQYDLVGREELKKADKIKEGQYIAWVDGDGNIVIYDQKQKAVNRTNPELFDQIKQELITYFGKSLAKLIVQNREVWEQKQETKNG